jgi:hypothetical protein
MDEGVVGHVLRTPRRGEDARRVSLMMEPTSTA